MKKHEKFDFCFLVYGFFILYCTKKMISWKEDINENTLYLFTDWASRRVFNEKTKIKSWRYWWEGIRLVYIDDRYETKIIDLSDYISYTQYTNNDMELKAVVDWLKYLLKSDLIQKYHKIIVATDADYVYSDRWMAMFYRSWRWRKNSSWFWLQHKKLWKEFYKICKLFSDMWIRCSCEWIKGHNGNEFNEMADKSAVAWACSKNRVPAEKRRWIRRPFLNEVKFDDKIEVNWEKWLLIHVTNYAWWLWKWWIRFICEVVDRKNKYFGYRFYLSTNKPLSSKYIYEIDISSNDKYRHILESVNWEFSKQEIREKILNAWISEDVFYKSKNYKKKK